MRGGDGAEALFGGGEGRGGGIGMADGRAFLIWRGWGGEEEGWGEGHLN